MINLQSVFQETSELLDEKMDRLLPEPDYGKEGRLFEAMRYSTLSQGKRIRPFLTIAAAGLFGVSKTSSLQTAAAIEFVHAYSLIHDDLPAMDNDDMRRGQPSCHKKFDEATAILAGDALLTLSFEILADPTTHADSAVRSELISSLAKAAGGRGMVGGQMMDLACEHSDLSINEITRLQRMKTGALFAISCEAGAILGKASRNLRTALKGYAYCIGLAFQITDDLLDTLGSSDKTGKSVRKDKAAGKATYVSALGLEQAKDQSKMLSDQAISHLEVFDSRADILRDLARFVIERQN
jgi:farnesyl diphosphate synthase